MIKGTVISKAKQDDLVNMGKDLDLLTKSRISDPRANLVLTVNVPNRLRFRFPRTNINHGLCTIRGREPALQGGSVIGTSFNVVLVSKPVLLADTGEEDVPEDLIRSMFNGVYSSHPIPGMVIIYADVKGIFYQIRASGSTIY